MSIQLDCHGITDVGKVRPENEDQFLIADLNKSMKVYQTSLGLDHQTRLYGNSQGKLLVVADGMGGHEAGERASTLAIDGIAAYVLNTLSWFFRLNEQSEEDFEDDLRQSLIHCQTILKTETEAMPQRHGMGTTLTLAYVMWPRMYVVHVGDSRCYLCRNGDLEQITNDHTIGELYRQSLENSGDGIERPSKRFSRALWNVIGGVNDELSPEVSHCSLEVGDAILLCSDGLTLHISDEEIAKVLSSSKSANATTTELVTRANEAGGKDNITSIVAKFTDQEQPISHSMELEIETPQDLADTVPVGEVAAAVTKQ